MKICYCDESGTGEEPIAVMAGIIVDSQRMHVTKEHWSELVKELSKIVKRPVPEIHIHEFYRGNKIWREMAGSQRTEFIDSVFKWLVARKHHIVYTTVLKRKYEESNAKDNIPKELNTLWRFLGFHLIISMQKAYQAEQKNKGNTIFIFDNQHREELKFVDLINNSPYWSDSYYVRGSKEKPLNQIIDVPYFADSKEVVLIQLADFVSYFIRRHAEIREGLIGPQYDGEDKRIEGWMEMILSRSIGRSFIYPSKGRCVCAEMFYQHAPSSIRTM